MRREDIHVGDRLRIRQWHDMEEEFGLNDMGEIDCTFIFAESMEDLCGIEFTVENIDGDGVIFETDHDRGLGGWMISADMCEPVESEDPWFPPEIDADEFFSVLLS